MGARLSFNKWKEKKSVLILTSAFIVSRIIFNLSGVVFYGDFIKRLWQLIDVALLKNNLLQSLFYSHAQPPLFNFFSGIVLKIFPQHYAIVFHITFAGIGWLCCILIYLSLRRLHVARIVSMLAAFYFMLCPAVILYENLFSYTYPSVLLLTISLYWLIVFIQEAKPVYWWLLWCSFSMLALTRSYFHFVWLIILLILLLWLLRRTEIPVRNLLIPAITSISVVFLWYLKNLIIFGTFTASSWLGMNLARIMPPATAIGSIGSFKPIHLYTGIVPDRSYPYIALLHNEYKTGGGFVNFYHIDYVQVSNRFKQDVIVEIKRQPDKYIARIKEAAVIYFSLATHAPFLDQNYNHIKGYATYFNADFSGFNKFKSNDFYFRYALSIMLCYCSLLVALMYGFMMNVFNKADKIVIWIAVFMLVYSIVVGSLIEFGENNRFRFESITIFLMLFVKTMSDFWKYYKKLRMKQV